MCSLKAASYQNEKALSTMPKLSCEACLPDIGKYYDDSNGIVANNQAMLLMATSHPHGARLLASGRVVVLRDEVCSRVRIGMIHRVMSPQHFRSNNIAVLLKAAPVQTSATAVLKKVKTYFMLSLVDLGTKGGKLGMTPIFLDLWTTDPFPTKDIAVTPRWPPSSDSLSVTDGTYELRAVPLTSIAVVTSRTIKVWERETFFWQGFTSHH